MQLHDTGFTSRSDIKLRRFWNFALETFVLEFSFNSVIAIITILSVTSTLRNSKFQKSIRWKSAWVLNKFKCTIGTK
jgi:hypothetical protein